MPLLVTEGRHVQMEIAAPRPTSQLDGVDNCTVTKWAESLLKSHWEMDNRWKNSAATQ